MRTIFANSADDALRTGIAWLKTVGVSAQSRNGPVVMSPAPVVTQYHLPRNRVVFNALRDANPVFHLAEALWMLAGCRNVAPLLTFNSTFGQYAEDNGEQHGAYGHRWRHYFGFDQIESAIRQLVDNPTSRQVVLQMWDAQADMATVVRDKPCNTHIYFNAALGTLDMTVCCRSNDVVLGAYGANVVHMSILHEFVASATGIPLGTYYQFSNNYHAYLNHEPTKRLLQAAFIQEDDEYAFGDVIVRHLLQPGEHWEDFLRDCEDLFAGGNSVRYCQFVADAESLMRAYMERKQNNPAWKERVAQLGYWDFAMAFRRWAERRDNVRE